MPTKERIEEIMHEEGLPESLIEEIFAHALLPGHEGILERLTEEGVRTRAKMSLVVRKAKFAELASDYLKDKNAHD